MSSEEMEAKENTKVGFREILRMILYFAAILAFTFCIIEFVGQRTVVSGSSMETTLSDGDNLIIDKLTYKFSDPKRFDIIIFPYQYEMITTIHAHMTLH